MASDGCVWRTVNITPAGRAPLERPLVLRLLGCASSALHACGEALVDAQEGSSCGIEYGVVG